MGSDIVLSAGVRQNLLSLQNTASLMATTQNRLATGKKVNTALDNPTNFFTSAALQSRAGDLSALLDSMSNGIKVLEAADNGITAITKTIEQMQSTLRQARQDKSFKSTSYAIDAAATGNLSFTGGAVIGTVNVPLTTGDTQPLLMAGVNFTPLDTTNGDETYSFDIALDGGAPTTITLDFNDDGGDTTISLAEAVTEINNQLTAATSDIRVRDSTTTPGRLEFYIASGTHVGTASTIAVSNFTNGGTTPSATTAFGFGAGANDAGADRVRTVDELVTAINNHANLTGKVRASNDNGRLRVENLSTGNLTLGGVSTVDGQIDGTAGSSVIDGNTVRANFVDQFNGYIDQLNKLSDDASFNGVKDKSVFPRSNNNPLDIALYFD